MVRNQQKVLCLSGSPRKRGNSEYCARTIFQSLKDHPKVRAELVRLVDHDIKPCNGCRSCIKKGHCVLKDGFEEVWQRVVASDMVVISAPIYWDSPPGVMKNFIDRSHGYFTTKELLKGKAFYLINVATVSGFQTCEAVYRSWLNYYGARINAKVKVYARDKGELEGKEDEKKKIQDLGEKIKRRILRS